MSALRVQKPPLIPMARIQCSYAALRQKGEFLLLEPLWHLVHLPSAKNFFLCSATSLATLANRRC